MSNEIKNNAWLKYSGAEREKIFDFCEGYKLLGLQKKRDIEI